MGGRWGCPPHCPSRSFPSFSPFSSHPSQSLPVLPVTMAINQDGTDDASVALSWGWGAITGGVPHFPPITSPLPPKFLGPRVPPGAPSSRQSAVMGLMLSVSSSLWGGSSPNSPPNSSFPISTPSPPNSLGSPPAPSWVPPSAPSSRPSTIMGWSLRPLPEGVPGGSPLPPHFPTWVPRGVGEGLP